MLISLLLTLTPLSVGVSREYPLWWGRAAHQLFLEAIGAADPALAEALHSGESGPRPFSVSSLMGAGSRGSLDAGRTYRLRFTAVEKQTAQALAWAATEGPLAPGREVMLDYLPFQVAAITPPLAQPGSGEPPAAPLGSDLPLPAAGEVSGEPAPLGNFPLSPSSGLANGTGTPGMDSWAALSTYQDLSAPYLLARVTPDRRVGFRFASPVTFKTAGKNQPVPLPELVFGSLLDRWNAFAPVVFPPEVRRYAAECLVISRYDLQSRSVGTKEEGLRVGAVGRVTYTTLNYDRYWMSVLHTLAQFALFSGVGAGTSYGMGQSRYFI